ncbi:hypothetical protein JA1_002737 [Spathaspora sp. JA1]|nr:hypothetical protein JA1_002737 [Spathaspora sp. JA1]
MSKLVEIVNDTSLTDEVKVTKLSNQISQFSPDELLSTEEIPVDSTYKSVINLIKIEQIIAQDPYNANLQQIIHTLSPPSPAPENNFTGWFLKVKYHDLISDVSYLINDLKYDNFIDLINKKLLNVKSIPLSNPYYSQLTSLIQVKILHLYLLSNYNFRNLNIAHYLQENLNVEQVNAEVGQLFENFKNNALISQDVFNLIISTNFNDNYFKIIEKMDKTKLYKNILENNIIRLSKYYTTIKISRIGEIFQLQNQGLNIDLEAVIFDMIITKKLSSDSC